MENNFPTIVFMRHGERGDCVIPSIESELEFDPILTENGKNQVRTAARFLTENFFQNQISNIEIYSSPLIRCLESSSIIMDEFHIDNKSIIISNLLLEFLAPQYFPVDPIKECLIKVKQKNEILQNFTRNIDYKDDNNKEFIKFPESLEECKTRFYHCYDYFSKEAIMKTKIVILVSHGIVFDFFPSYFHVIPSPYSLVPYAAISMIQFDGKDWKLRLSGYRAWK